MALYKPLVYKKIRVIYRWDLEQERVSLFDICHQNAQCHLHLNNYPIVLR